MEPLKIGQYSWTNIESWQHTEFVGQTLLQEVVLEVFHVTIETPKSFHLVGNKKTYEIQTNQQYLW